MKSICRCIIKSWGGKFVIMGVASTWSEIKGTTDYNALAQLLSGDELLVMVGVDDETRKNLSDNIICVPRTQSMEELAILYNITDVVLSLSRGETFGLTIAESMACGTPTIVYDNSAQPEVVSEDCGYVVPTGDIDALYKSISFIKERGKSYYSSSCRKRAELCYNKDDRYNDYITLYKDLLNNQR